MNGRTRGQFVADEWRLAHANAGPPRQSFPHSSLPLSLWESRRTPLNKLEHFRAVATRFEKHDVNYIALVKLAVIRIWFRLMSR